MGADKASEFELQVRCPSECGEEMVAEIIALIRSGGEVEERGLVGRVKRAHYLGAGSLKNQLVSVGAVKRLEAHHQTVISNSGYKALSDYSAEIGYLYTVPSYRGQGIGQQVFQGLIKQWEGPVYATTRVCNKGMHHVLRKYGFTRVGKAWPSSRTPGIWLCLWVSPKRRILAGRGEA